MITKKTVKMIIILSEKLLTRYVIHHIGMLNPVDSVALIQKKHEYSSSQKINICGNTL